MRILVLCIILSACFKTKPQTNVDPKPDFIKGNLWYGRERYNVDVAELSN